LLSMQTLSLRARHEREPWHGNCAKRSSQLRGSCRTMQPSAGGSRPRPRLRSLPQRFPGLAPPACKRAALTRHSSAPTPAAQRTTRRCPFPVRCHLCRWRKLCPPGTRVPAWTATAGLLQLCREALRFPPSRPSVPLLVPCPPAAPHSPDSPRTFASCAHRGVRGPQQRGLAFAAAHAVALAHAPQPDRAAAAGT
jgi:hypothetical protein